MRISDAARALANPFTPPKYFAPASPPTTASEATAIDAAADAVDNDPILILIRSMVEMLTGQTIKIFSSAEFSGRTDVSTQDTARLAQSVQGNQATPGDSAQRPAGYGVEYDYHAVHEEAETTQFSAEGVVRTTDGQEISFKLDLAMTRYYREETSVSIRRGDAVRKDPLVINFNGQAAQLSNQRFSFDLNNDGRAEDLPTFASGSGYLALDLNHNGKIDSGAELFGPATNSGFAELARHDQDGNGWIDENDSVFKDLLVWTPKVGGSGTATSLREAGVGALSLARVASPFELRDAANTDLGAVRASGLWLDESGRAGSLQEIDLTV